MMAVHLHWKRTLMLTVIACALVYSASAYAQGRGGGGQGGPAGGGGGGMGGGMGARPNLSGRDGIPAAGSPGGFGRGGFGINRGGAGIFGGPVGRWWDNRTYSSALKLRPEQTRRMDAIFNQNRGELLSRYQALRDEESKLEFATRDQRLNQGSIFTQIDRVANSRDALDKTNTRLLGDLRKELDPDQINRMQTLK
jgi:Spy/CpxP family protein refolding chaperone